MFRGKESSNRIKISRLVQDLLNFGVLGSLWLWGGSRWVGGIWGHLAVRGGVTTCMHMHVHACTLHAHTCIKLQMSTNMEASMFSMFIMFNMHVHAFACMCVHVCMHGTLPHTPIPTPTPIHPSATPPPRRVDPQNQ